MSSLFHSMLLASLLPLISCTDRTLAKIDINQTSEVRETFDVSENRDVDFLFVIDNSNSMALEQISLADKFKNLITALSNHPDGLPSVHIAVVSTDLGGGGFQNGCSIAGDDGQFLGTQCGGLTDTFVKSIASDDGERIENFEGELSDVFSCMATLGTKGCGFEQPLASMRRALEQPQAQAFLRPHAYLAVIFVTDEDDCSVHDTAIFNTAPSGLDSELGPPKSFRCFEFGVECDEDPRSLGKHTNCIPKDGSSYLKDVNGYVEFLYQLKESPTQVLVASIAGEMDKIEVITRTEKKTGLEYYALDYSCDKEDAEAVPPIRLNAFIDGFAEDSGQRTSICEPDLSGALDDIAKLIIDKATPCIAGSLADVDQATAGLQPECVISETRPGQAERRLKQCDNPATPPSSGNLPCFTLEEDEQCAAYPTKLSPKIYYDAGHTVLPGTVATASCRVDS